MNLFRYDDVLIDLDEVTLLIGSAVVMKDGKMHDIGVKAADAMRSAFKPAEKLLREGFYVKNPEGKNVAFGERLLSHIASHDEKDANGRLARLQFAVSTVTYPDRIEKNHRGYEGRALYARKFANFGMIAISEPNKDTIDEIFTIVPKRNGGVK